MRRISDTLARLAARSYPSVPSDQPSRLAPLDDFGANPGALGAHYYVPPKLRPGAALVVVLHGCLQQARDYDGGSGWSCLAERAGFAVLYPEQRRANNMNLCFNWFDRADIARTGGEAESIADMVATMLARHALASDRIFVTGLSAGGAMTAVLLATYPDLFSAGAIIAGVPYGDAIGVAQALERMRGRGGATVAAAAARVRAAAPGLAARPPMVSIWHGDADSTVAPANAAALVGQWCAVHDVSAVPGETQRGARWSRSIWRDAGGRAAVEQWTIAGMGHGVPIDPAGPDGLGRAGPYLLDVGLSSTRAIAHAWGLCTGPAYPRSDAAADDTAGHATRHRDGAAMAAQAMLARVLRMAGLLR